MLQVYAFTNEAQTYSEPVDNPLEVCRVLAAAGNLLPVDHGIGSEALGSVGSGRMGRCSPFIGVHDLEGTRQAEQTLPTSTSHVNKRHQDSKRFNGIESISGCLP